MFIDELSSGLSCVIRDIERRRVRALRFLGPLAIVQLYNYSLLERRPDGPAGYNRVVNPHKSDECEFRSEKYRNHFKFDLIKIGM